MLNVTPTRPLSELVKFYHYLACRSSLELVVPLTFLVWLLSSLASVRSVCELSVRKSAKHRAVDRDTVENAAEEDERDEAEVDEGGEGAVAIGRKKKRVRVGVRRPPLPSLPIRMEDCVALREDRAIKQSLCSHVVRWCRGATFFRRCKATSVNRRAAASPWPYSRKFLR